MAGRLCGSCHRSSCRGGCGSRWHGDVAGPLPGNFPGLAPQHPPPPLVLLYLGNAFKSSSLTMCRHWALWNLLFSNSVNSKHREVRPIGRLHTAGPPDPKKRPGWWDPSLNPRVHILFLSGLVVGGAGEKTPRVPRAPPPTGQEEPLGYQSTAGVHLSPFASQVVQCLAVSPSPSNWLWGRMTPLVAMTNTRLGMWVVWNPPL